MLDFIRIIAHSFTILVVGFIVVKLFFPKLQINIKTFSLFYGLGSGFITLQMFFLSLLGFKFSFSLILLPWAILLPLVPLKKQNEIKKYISLRDFFTLFRNIISDSNLTLKALFVLVLSFSLLEIIMGIPLIAWDAWAHWGFKAKIFYLQQHVPMEMYSDKFSIVPIKEYPLLVTLSETFFYNFLGRFDDSRVNIVFLFFYTSFLIYFYSLLKAICGKEGASLFTLFFATIPIINEFAFGYYIGYADLIFTYFNFISITCLWLWFLKGKEELFYISCIFAGFAFWTKIEGIVLLLANLTCMFFVKFFDKENERMKVKLFFIYFLILLIISGPWYLIVSLMGFSFSSSHTNTESFALSMSTIFERSRILGGGFLMEALSFSRWNIFWFLFILSPLLYFKKLFNKFNRIILINFGVQLGLYTLIMIIHADLVKTILECLHRVMVHLTPIVLLLIASILYRDGGLGWEKF